MKISLPKDYKRALTMYELDEAKKIIKAEKNGVAQTVPIETAIRGLGL